MTKLDAKKTAVLSLDLQQGLFGSYPAAEAVIGPAQKALEFGRAQGMRVIHVGIGFSEGHPEIPDSQLLFARIKQGNLFVKGTASTAFHPAIQKPGDLVIYKQRISAFSENDLHLVLRSQGIEHLVLFGISTSGIVLSTVRRAFDLDFGLTILSDACFDPDAEVHRVLTEKVYPRQGSVLTVDAWLASF